MRSCARFLSAFCYAGSGRATATALFSSSGALLAPRKATTTTNNKRKKGKKATAVDDDYGSLASFAPAIAATWMAAASSKMMQPHHVKPDSVKLAWWCCPSCGNQFNKRIGRHVACGGECPKCHARPSNLPRTAHKGMASNQSNSGSDSVVVHRSRPNSSLSSLVAENANMIKKSVADSSYLRSHEKRNLVPMLAKNYEKESGKIHAAEVVAVSPKLDGIRCVTAYDATADKILFFSRAGTLFECCDAKVEPYLRTLFRADPTLVLDGELYNDSANLQRMSALLPSSTSSSSSSSSTTSSSSSTFVNAVMVALFAEETNRVNPLLKLRGTATTTATATKGKKSSAASSGGSSSDADAVINFDQLTSAIRVSRKHRTAAHEALQHQLQYHIFDILYCDGFPTERDSPPFRIRYKQLESLIAQAHAANAAAFTSNRNNIYKSFIQSASTTTTAASAAAAAAFPYDGTTLRLVPSLSCTKGCVDGLLRAAMAVGFEGVMVRRDGLGSVGKAAATSNINSNNIIAVTDQDTDSNHDSSSSSSKKHAKSSSGAMLNAAEVTAQVRSAQRAIAASSPSSAKSFKGCDGGYGYGNRSSTLMKYKVMQDSEFVIVSAVEGKGKWTGRLGAFVCETPQTKKTFTVTPASTDAQKRKMWATWKKEYKGKALTVQYQELTADGMPRFPIGKTVRGAANGSDWI